MKIIFDISVIFPTTTGDKLFLQKRKNLLYRLDYIVGGVGIQNFEPRPPRPRPLLPQQQNFEPLLPEDWKVV
ncbi:MAG: hypothetical protein KBA43_08325 [Paludibacteraceae bacterium]|nr:hypothetical protein [Paludibacteraceae bacterium]